MHLILNDILKQFDAVLERQNSSVFRNFNIYSVIIKACNFCLAQKNFSFRTFPIL